MSVAVKIIDIVSLNDPSVDENRKFLENEQRLVKLRHDNIVGKFTNFCHVQMQRSAAMYGYYEVGQSFCHLVLEFMPGGSLKGLLGRATTLTTDIFFYSQCKVY